jgi:hypothetical protein
LSLRFSSSGPAACACLRSPIPPWRNRHLYGVSDAVLRAHNTIDTPTHSFRTLLICWLVNQLKRISISRRVGLYPTTGVINGSTLIRAFQPMPQFQVSRIGTR